MFIAKADLLQMLEHDLVRSPVLLTFFLTVLPLFSTFSTLQFAAPIIWGVKWRFAHFCTQAITYTVSDEVEVLHTTILNKTRMS